VLDISFKLNVYSTVRFRVLTQGLHHKPNRRRLKLKDVMRYRGVVEGLERSGREVR